MGCSSSSIVQVYTNHPDAVILACYFNPKNNEHRKLAFLRFYESIQNCNHRIIECVVGESDFLFPSETPHIRQVRTSCLLWHKEALLNILIRELPARFKYVFWVDGDITFTNKNWIVDSVEKLQSSCTIIQPFRFAIHMEKGEVKPSPATLAQKDGCGDMIEPKTMRRVWRSYGSVVEDYRAARGNYVDSSIVEYDLHGHVGFAWGIRREILDSCGGLYDRALVGGGDHIMAHAVMTAPPNVHRCIQKCHTEPEELRMIALWSRTFHSLCGMRLGSCGGDVYHTWHGELSDRRYFQRICEFSPYIPRINERDTNGLFFTKDPAVVKYMNEYFASVSSGSENASKSEMEMNEASESAEDRIEGGYYD